MRLCEVRRRLWSQTFFLLSVSVAWILDARQVPQWLCNNSVNLCETLYWNYYTTTITCAGATSHWWQKSTWKATRYISIYLAAKFQHWLTFTIAVHWGCGLQSCRGWLHVTSHTIMDLFLDNNYNIVVSNNNIILMYHTWLALLGTMSCTVLYYQAAHCLLSVARTTNNTATGIYTDILSTTTQVLMTEQEWAKLLASALPV